MAVRLQYPIRGRGAWPTGGAGGTLKADGLGPGRYYRVPATPDAPLLGTIGVRADRDNALLTIDDYATWRAVIGVQAQLAALAYTGADMRPLVCDGVWGRNTEAALRAFQATHGVTADGVFGPATARSMFGPVVAAAADGTGDRRVGPIMHGTVGHESGYDPGAVGASTPQDLGLGQLNGIAHPALDAAARLDPRTALPVVAQVIARNLVAMGNERDAVAAYRYGVSGARAWVAAARPRTWKNTDAWAYISTILEGTP